MDIQVCGVYKNNRVFPFPRKQQPNSITLQRFCCLRHQLKK
jgi:hypothetical protein